MSTAEERELAALRERAYGPGGGLDAEALRRLQQLEDARRPSAAARAPEPDAAERPPEPQPVVVTADPEPTNRLRLAARWLLDRLQRLPRSAVLITLGGLALVTIVTVGLTLAQRAQTAPLQPDTHEVARLGLDSTYRAPRLFAGMDGDIPVQTYESFHGLRTIMVVGGIFSRGTSDECLVVFAEQDIEDPESDGFSGQLMGGCAAGEFPASTQFASTLDGYPDELRDAFPDSALQFVHDSESNEVVVFVSAL